MAKVVGSYKAAKENVTVQVSNRHADPRYQRLRDAVQNSGGRDAVADRSGVGKTTLTQYMKDGDWKLSFLEKLASACGVSMEWLISGNGENEPAVTVRKHEELPSKDGESSKFIAGYDVELSAGYGFTPNTHIEVVSFSISSDALPPELLQPYRKLIAVRARGDSMEPYVCSGDIIVLDLNDRSIFTGGVYGLRVGDQLLVKRLSIRANGNLIVASDNPRYPPDEISAAEMRQMTEDGGSPMTIIGRLVWRMGMGIS